MKLLIVDDQKGIRKLLTEVFADQVSEIQACASGLSALEIIPEFKPDLILMDVKMPGLSGIEVLRRLRASGNKVRVVLMTAYSDQYHMDEAKELDIDSLLMKPFDLNELKEHIVGILKQTG